MCGSIGKIVKGIVVKFIHKCRKNFKNSHFEYIIPSNIVVYMFGRNTTKLIKEVINIVMVRIYVIDMIDTILMLISFNLDKLIFLDISEFLVTLFTISHKKIKTNCTLSL